MKSGAKHTPVVALDTNIFISVLSGDELSSQAATQLLKDIRSGVIMGTCSVLVLGEVISTGRGLGNAASTVTNFLESFNLKKIPVDESIATTAGELRAKYAALRLPDAIHLATAVQCGADVFVTNDLQLAKVGGKVMPTKTLLEEV